MLPAKVFLDVETSAALDTAGMLYYLKMEKRRGVGGVALHLGEQNSRDKVGVDTLISAKNAMVIQL